MLFKKLFIFKFIGTIKQRLLIVNIIASVKNVFRRYEFITIILRTFFQIRNNLLYFKGV